MSNELCVKYLPYCRATAERKAILRKCLAELNEDEVGDRWFCGENIEEIRETLSGVADEYWNFDKYAEVCVIRPPESPIPYLVSGGMWRGDNSPSDSYDVMCMLSDWTGLWGVLLKWAMEDIMANKGITEVEHESNGPH